jgi:putative ABC transport system permease protein
MIGKLILGNVREQPLQWLLAILLCTLGLISAITIMWLQHTLAQHASRQAQGIDLIVGAKGSALQNTLAGVYHVDVPNGNIQLSDVEALAKHPMVAAALPISLGDSVGGARIVGATTAFYALYGALPSSGALPAAPMEAALGASAATRLKLSIGDSFVGNHGIGEGAAAHDSFPYNVVTILKPTGRVIDELVVTPLESVWAVHAAHAASPTPEVTFALIQTRSPVAMATLPRYINAQTNMQAASPAAESARALATFGWLASLVKGFAGALALASLGALLVALLQALDRRKTDLALLRAMGVSRGIVWQLLIGESMLVVLIAGAVAAISVSIAALLLAQFGLPGVKIDPWYGATVTFVSILIALALAFVATLPMIRRAFTIDIAKQLSKL